MHGQQLRAADGGVEFHDGLALSCGKGNRLGISSVRRDDVSCRVNRQMGESVCERERERAS